MQESEALGHHAEIESFDYIIHICISRFALIHMHTLHIAFVSAPIGQGDHEDRFLMTHVEISLSNFA